jgi:ABC-type oligopeptide transport system ATPase subunit
VSTLLEVTDLHVRYKVRGGKEYHAIKGVDFAIGKGETLGLVGESGSGKSTIGKAVLGLAPISQGSVHINGKSRAEMNRRELREISRHLQVIFQDPYGSLNPTKTIGSTLAESTLVFQGSGEIDVQARMAEVMEQVGMPANTLGRYPSEFSGGQRQRIAIARALMTKPSLIVCDEPVSALDLSIQAQVLNLLTELQSELGVSYLFISHDLSVIRYMSEQMLVLNLGEVVERGNVDEIYRSPKHPYTKRLLDATPGRELYQEMESN